MPLDAFIPHPHDRLVPWLVVLAAAGLGALIDFRSRRLPNNLTLSLWLAGILFSTALGGLMGLGEALGASLLLAGPYVILFLFAGGGAGDAKMMGAIGAWLGLAHGAAALLAVAVMGGLAGLVVSLARGEGRRLARNLSSASTGLIAMAYGHVKLNEAEAVMPPSDEMRPMPYGVAILLGVLTAFAGGLLWHAQ